MGWKQGSESNGKIGVDDGNGDAIREKERGHGSWGDSGRRNHGGGRSGGGGGRRRKMTGGGNRTVAVDSLGLGQE